MTKAVQSNTVFQEFDEQYQKGFFKVIETSESDQTIQIAHPIFNDSIYPDEKFFSEHSIISRTRYKEIDGNYYTIEDDGVLVYSDEISLEQGEITWVYESNLDIALQVSRYFELFAKYTDVMDEDIKLLFTPIEE